MTPIVSPRLTAKKISLRAQMCRGSSPRDPFPEQWRNGDEKTLTGYPDGSVIHELAYVVALAQVFNLNGDIIHWLINSVGEALLAALERKILR
jgi:hypothetical protein